MQFLIHVYVCTKYLLCFMKELHVAAIKFNENRDVVDHKAKSTFRKAMQINKQPYHWRHTDQKNAHRLSVTFKETYQVMAGTNPPFPRWYVYQVSSVTTEKHIVGRMHNWKASICHAGCHGRHRHRLSADRTWITTHSSWSSRIDGMWSILQAKLLLWIRIGDKPASKLTV